ncbi:hypothetical protein SLS62_007037 [Diatrype stigma]|uniref:Sin3-associated polypeptide Sap18 n=1 Tax=Diatrype stigma TaxID=117547 RepID=A0AAN9YQQ6_9PEZI
MRPDEFATTPLPSHLTIHTWPDCTLTELTEHVAAAASSASLPLLPDPAIGTRLAYRLIFADTRGASGGGSGPAGGGGGGGFALAHSRYIAKDIGSVVIGDGGPALDPNDIEATKKAVGVVQTPNGEEEEDGVGKDKGGNGDSDGNSNSDGSKTLAEARFVPGDFVSCAILPPLPDGSVAPASDARTGRGVGVGEARPLDSYSSSGGGGGDSRERENGFPRAGGRGGYGGYGGYGGPGGGDRSGLPSRHNRGMVGGGGGGARGSGGNVPFGEWRRGERLPDVPPAGRPRGRGRW